MFVGGGVKWREILQWFKFYVCLWVGVKWGGGSMWICLWRKANKKKRGKGGTREREIKRNQKDLRTKVETTLRNVLMEGE